MPQRKQPIGSLPVLDPHTAGIDVHAAVHWVAVPPGDAPTDPKHPSGLPPEVRSFGACTADLEEIADWLKQCRVSSVAMESTGVYWIPLFELLERRGFKVMLVDPRRTRQVSGRPKSDRLDCQWIRRLHSCGLLAGSFRPADDIVVLRGYLRQRQRLIEDAGRQVQHMQKALEEMNVKLTEVVSDVVGKTGLSIIKAIIKGERDAEKLAKLRDEKCKRSETEIARALVGSWREEHLFALKQAVKLYEVYHGLLDECDKSLEACLKTFADKSGGEELPAKRRSCGRKANDFRFEARALLHRMSGADLTVIEGIEASTAMSILGEIGPDVSKFPSVKHFTSWLGLSPNHQGSAGKIKSRRVRRGANRAARAFRTAALGCNHAKHALGAFYRRIAMRCGGPKAVIATARKIAERVYRLLKDGREYERRDASAYEESYRKKVLKGLTRRAAELGYRLELVSAETVACSSE
jgi:transposase